MSQKATKNNPNELSSNDFKVFLAVTIVSIIVGAIFIIVFITVWGPDRSASELVENPHIFQVSDTEKLKVAKRYAGFESPSIFVGIASYRDPELCLTVEDLFYKALHPERIFVGVVEQNDSKDSVTAHIINANTPWKNNVRSKTLHYKDAKGPTYARHLCEGLFQGENYYLLTDSHMRFETGWDSILLQMLSRCRRPERTIITMYPEGYQKKQKKSKEFQYCISNRKGWRYQQMRMNDEGIPEFSGWGSVRKTTNCHPVPMISANFAFANSEWMKQVPYRHNTDYLFMGEEFDITARSLSKGWDLVGPSFNVVYHLWDRSKRTLFWVDHRIELRRKKSLRMIKDALYYGKDDGIYSMGTVRTRKEIWDYLGVDPMDGVLTRTAKEWKPPKNWKPIDDQFVKNP